MLINKIRIKRFRAFDKEVIIPLGSMTVLTGPNNLGKSTVLAALDIFFSYFGGRTGDGRISRGPRYNFERDYPKLYEGKKGRRWPTTITVEFEFTAAEREEIYPANPNKVLSLIPISLIFEYDSEVKDYRPSRAIPDTIEPPVKAAIRIWIREKVRYIYIPATRNVESFRRQLFTELVTGALARVSRSKQRLLAIKKFHDELVSEIKEISDGLAEEVRAYLPATKKILFHVEELDLANILELSEVEVDDGARTQLQLKGDGFKSLFAISFLQYISKQRFGKNILFGIEEPESHLHSSAVYEIKSSLRKLSESYQVIITTHSPILIQRDDLSSNVIVEEAISDGFSSVAKPAVGINDIRKSLGIRPQENLATAEIVVVVEGVTEERVIPVLIRRLSPEVFDEILSGRVRILSANSAANVPAVVRALARDVTSTIVLADNDEEGRNAVNRVKTSGLLSPGDVFFVAQREGCRDTEFEDLFEIDLYLDNVARAAGIMLTSEIFVDFQRKSGGRQIRCEKWSKVMERIATAQGTDWSAVKEDVRTAFATAVIEKSNEIETEKLIWLQGLVAQLTRYIRG
jgi:putative ATP-dependent endonuclease of the OLD family